MAGFVPAADRLLAELKSPAKLILNEFVNSVTCHDNFMAGICVAFFQ